MKSKVWNLVCILGATGTVVSHADNPMTRKKALDGAAAVTKNGWPCWVIDDEGKREIFVNEFEQSRRATCANTGTAP
jgi:hypothetical protein